LAIDHTHIDEEEENLLQKTTTKKIEDNKTILKRKRELETVDEHAPAGGDGETISSLRKKVKTLLCRRQKENLTAGEGVDLSACRTSLRQAERQQNCHNKKKRMMLLMENEKNFWTVVRQMRKKGKPIIATPVDIAYHFENVVGDASTHDYSFPCSS
jgi:hypothetical protein